MIYFRRRKVALERVGQRTGQAGRRGKLDHAFNNGRTRVLDHFRRRASNTREEAGKQEETKQGVMVHQARKTSMFPPNSVKTPKMFSKILML